MEENRRKFHNDIECVKHGFANGSALDRPLTDEEKNQMIEEATVHFGNFLTALKCDWQNDPNSADTPRRVAKAYVKDLWAGRYNGFTDITSFPSDGYDGVIIERTNISLGRFRNDLNSCASDWINARHWIVESIDILNEIQYLVVINLSCHFVSFLTLT